MTERRNHDWKLTFGSRWTICFRVLRAIINTSPYCHMENILYYCRFMYRIVLNKKFLSYSSSLSQSLNVELYWMNVFWSTIFLSIADWLWKDTHTHSRRTCMRKREMVRYTWKWYLVRQTSSISGSFFMVQTYCT